MSNIAQGAALMVLLALSGRPAPPARPGETITVSRRPWFAVCAGVCPHYDVTVGPDGRGWSVRHRFDLPDLVRPLRVTRAGSARFRGILEAYRPGPADREIAGCRHHVAPEALPLVVKTVEIEVKWSGPRGSAHLIACDTPQYRRLNEAIDAALASLGLDVTAAPRRR